MDVYPITDAKYPARTVAYTGTAGTTSTWPIIGNGGTTTGGVWVWTTTDAYVVVGNSVTATTSNGIPIPAYTPVTLPIPADVKETWTVSAIQISAGGTLYAKPLAGN